MAITKKYQALFENSITAFFITRPDGTILEANRAACRLFDYSEEELRKIGRQGIIDQDSPGLSEKLMERDEKGSASGELIGVRKNGEKFWCEFSTSVFEGPDGDKMASMVLIDIFETKNGQESLKGVMNNVPGVLYRYVTDYDGFEKMQYVSGGVKQVLGFNPDEIFEDGSLGLKNIHEDDVEDVVQSMKESSEKNTKWVSEYRYHHPDGTMRWLRGMGNPVSNKNGRVVWDTIVIDITAEKKAETLQHKNEKELTLIFDTISDAIFTLSIEKNEVYRFLKVNNQFLKNLGKQQDEVIGKKLEDVVPPENITFVKSKYSEAVASGKNLCWEETIHLKNGTKTGIVSVTPLFDEEGICYQLVGSISDISERKAAENELTRVLDQSLDVICTIDNEGKFVKVSKASSKIWGYEPEELEGKAYIDLVHSDDIEKTNKVAEEIMSGVNVTNFENRYRRKDGSVVPIIWSARWDKDDKLMYCVAKDATERIKTEEIITGERRRYERLFKKMPAFVSMTEGPEHRNILANPVFCQITGRSEDQLKGKTAKEAFPELMEQGFIEILDEVYKTGEPFEIKEMEVYVEVSKGQGPTRRFYDFVYLPNRGVDGNIEGILAFGMDVTHQVEARENLKISNTRYELVTKATSDAIWDFVPETDKLFWGEGFNTLFGYDVEKLETGIDKWMKNIHPSDLEKIRPAIDELMNGPENSWDREYRFRKGDGSYTFVKDKAIVIRDDSGNPARVIGAMEDITDQKIREYQKSLAANVSFGFNKAVDLKDALQKTINYIIELKNFELVEFWMADRDKKQLLLFAHHYAPGVSEEFHSIPGEAIVFNKGKGLPGHAWKKNKPLFWRNLDNRKTFIRNKLAKNSGLKTGFAYPVMDGKDVAGVLVLAVKEDLKTEPYYSSIFRDLAVQLVSEINRKQLEEELSRIFDSAPDGIIVAGFDGYLKKMNPAFCEILGYSKEELLTTPFIEFVHPEDRERTIQEYESANSGEYKSYFENRYIKKSGQVVWLSWSYKVFLEEEIAYSVAKDITEQKELKELLDQANRLAKIGSWGLDLRKNNNELYWSDMTKEILEVSEDYNPTLTGGFEFYFPESKELIQQAVDIAINEGKPFDLELLTTTAKGNEKWIRCIGQSEMVRGKCVRLYGSFQDIHLRKVTELKLEERNRHINVIASLNASLLDYSDWFEALKNHLEMIGEAVRSDRVYYFENRFDPDTGDGYTTQKLEWCREGITSQLNNPDLEEISFKEVPELVDPMIKGHQSMTSLSEVNEGTTTRYVMEDQDIKTFLAIPVIVQGDFYGFVGFDNCTEEVRWSEEEVRTLKTITSNLAIAIERNQIENERKKLLNEKNRILESISDAFYAIDENWKISYFNKEAERLLDRVAEQVIGNNFWEEFEPAKQTELFSVYKDVMVQKKPKSIEYYDPPINAWYDISAYPAENGISVYFKNIDERIKAQEKILLKTRQLDAIASFNTLLIKKESWLDALNESLQLFGEVTNADRVYFFDTNRDQESGSTTVNMLCEWVTGGVSEEIKNPDHQNVPIEFLGEFIEPLKSNKVYSNDVENIKDSELREMLKAQKIKSVLTVPVFVDKQFHGIIGFDDCKQERTWKSEEISFLQTISLNLASAIENEEAEVALQKAFKEKNKILESIGDGFFAVDNNLIVEYWNYQAEELLFTPKEKVLNQYLWDVFDKNLAQKSYQQYSKALKERIPLKFEDYYKPIGRWFDVNVYPSQNGISVFFKDITERKQAEEKLKELNQSLKVQAKELARSNEELEQFAFVASHDLQEPLRMITSFLAQLERKYEDILDEKGKKYIYFATDGARRMRQIILDLLDFSRVGRVDMEKSQVDVHEILENIQTLHHKIIDEKGATVIWGNMPVVFAARGPLQQLFQNLINNALKYHENDHQPKVKISSIETETHWGFSVKDNGIGIKEEYKEKIFNIFQRLHHKDEYSGTGVGLAICKKIVEMHGGEIWLESEEDKGSTFYFTIAKSTELDFK